MAAIKPLSDTQRIIEWDELPESVREIPDDFNPLLEGVYMKHQTDWIKLIHAVDISVAEKCRRSGITLATAFDDTITAASRKSAGGSNVFYVGDTREKGLEFIGYCAKFSRIIVAAQGGNVSQIEQFIFADQDAKGESTREIQAFRIRFASGYRIVALSSRPENLRGLQGIVDIDEAAYHKDVGKVIESAVALLMWGGKIRIISTHNGTKNPFNQLVQDVKGGLYGKAAAVFSITFDECVANGLYERVCFMQNKTPTEEDKRDWYLRIRGGYGPRKSAMREELDVIPRDGDGSAIPGLLIQRAMKTVRPILRWTYDDDYRFHAPELRTRETAERIRHELLPLLGLLVTSTNWYIGMDFARRRNLSVIVPLCKKQDLCRFVPFVIELHNCPQAQQQEILWALIAGLPNFKGGALDATGPGQGLAELTWDKWNTVEQVVLNLNWYRVNMPPLVGAFEDDLMDIPRDKDHESDLRDLVRTEGIIHLPKASTESDDGIMRHGDFAIALALADYAARVDRPVLANYENVHFRFLS